MVNVFVYGTLMKNRGAHRYMNCDDDPIHAVSVDKFKMFLFGFPAISPFEEGHLVKGEIYAVDDQVLNRLDSYEGCPTHYMRETRKFLTDNGELEAQVYIYNPRNIYGNETEAQPRSSGYLEF